MGGKEAKVLQFKNRATTRTLPTPKKQNKRKLPQLARIYQDASPDLGSRQINPCETEQATKLLNRLFNVEKKAENLNLKILSRYHSGEYSKQEATIELMRLGLIQNISTTLRKILKNSLLEDPVTFRCAMIVGENFRELIKNREFMPERATFPFPSSQESVLERIQGEHASFMDRLDGFAPTYPATLLTMDKLKENAKKLIRMYSSRKS